MASSGFKACKIQSALLRKPVVHGKVYRGSDWEERSFWRDEKPSIPRQNAFVHATTNEWKKFDKLAKRKTLDITQVADALIKNNRIHESLVHEMLKMMFAKEGWWVNFEVPILRGRIDFLVKQGFTDRYPWRVIEVKLEDNPKAVDQLHTYIDDIKSEVRKIKDPYDSYYWLLCKGQGKCVKLKGVVLCADPGTETREEARKYDYDVWTYKYTFKGKSIGIRIKNAKTGNPYSQEHK